ncbi:hypothetical protein M413DRAFT_24115 [Hebeloma cylindrosporum]|uniref:DUF4050 domain-containing protein n=1 Tax=Hebeloma cylindrosporum TaxID=76867 RepID=A0A0C2YZH9_HEBCY|nr:hypothetical protein M413DRAFT_24115 [Hebeloma cylindrosporum h7]
MPSSPSFDQILQAASLPEPGPDYYAARRRIWLTPTRAIPPPPPASSSRQRLENLFNSNGPSIVYSHEAWRNGLEKVWKGLSSGVRLKYKLPLNIVIKIIHASWVRDKVWPVGMQAPESDEEQQPDEAPLPIFDTLSTSSSSLPTAFSTFTNSEVMETMPPPRIDQFR